MGKRNIRIRRNELAAQTPGLVGQEVHVILEDDRTLFGKVISGDAHQITIRDVNAAWYNRKKHTHPISLDNVREIIADQITDF